MCRQKIVVVWRESEGVRGGGGGGGGRVKGGTVICVSTKRLGHLSPMKKFLRTPTPQHQRFTHKYT